MTIDGFEIALERLIVPEGAKMAELNSSRVGPAHQQEIGLFTPQEGDIGKMRGEAGGDHAQIVGPKGIGLHPLNKYPARRQPLTSGGVIFIGEKRGNSGDPWVGWLGDDQVILLARG